MLLKQNLWTLKAVWIVPQPQQGTWLHTNCFEIKSADNEILSELQSYFKNPVVGKSNLKKVKEEGNITKICINVQNAGCGE